ncbi:MAG: hypothetical protein BRC58_07605 [Cyanobacteria bacterium QS_8_64_29]|nr:MAG: hypothetical protein BRC58_07605 [Cyanobacteria bacterium QS_8_64_29]
MAWATQLLGHRSEGNAMKRAGWRQWALVGLGLLAAIPAFRQATPEAILDSAYQHLHDGHHRQARLQFRALAERGVAPAQFTLGTLYDRGWGGPQDPERAVHWYRQAAIQGFAKAQYDLGLRYAQGQGVPKDLQKSLRWYRKAAQQGAAKAQYNLGLRYANGQSVSQDPLRAYMWFELAASQAAAEHLKADATHNRQVMASRLSPDRIRQAQRLAREWQHAHQ